LEVTYPSMGLGAGCLQGPGEYPTAEYAGTMTHPSGAMGRFGTRFQELTRKLPKTLPDCMDLIPRNQWGGVEEGKDFAIVPMSWVTQAIETKTISGPGVAPRTWSFTW